MKLLTASIFLFMVVLGIVHWLKPRYMYHDDGSLREFGVGYKQKTVTPMWLVVILVAIAAYCTCYLWLD
jgi:hypothetical protein